MTRPCDCDRVTGPAYTADQCRPCWLYKNDPRYRRLWDGEQSFSQPTAPPPPWPRLARLLARRRDPADRGLGDTLERHLARLGADALKRVYGRLTGTDCGCGDRRDRLNRRFAYPPPG